MFICKDGFPCAKVPLFIEMASLETKKTFQKEEEADSGSDMSAKKEERNLLSPMSFLIDNELVTVKGRERGSFFVQRQGERALT